MQRETAGGAALHAAVARLVSGGSPDPRAVAEFVARNEFPLVEPGAVTFAWRGAADHVHLMRWILAGADRQPFHRLPGTDLWLLRLPVRNEGRFEYKLAVGRDGHEELVLDPLNPAPGGRPVRREFRLPHRGLRTTGLDAPARRAERQHRVDRGRERGLWRATDRAGLPAGGI